MKRANSQAPATGVCCPVSCDERVVWKPARRGAPYPVKWMRVDQRQNTIDVTYVEAMSVPSDTPQIASYDAENWRLEIINLPGGLASQTRAIVAMHVLRLL